MENYQHYTVEEFAQDDFFLQWVQNPTAETKAFWLDFLTKYPEKRSEIIGAKALLKAIENTQTLPVQKQSDRMWAAIQQQMEENEPVKEEAPPMKQIRLWWSWAAAAVVLMIGLSWWLLPQLTQNKKLQATESIEWALDNGQALAEKVNEKTQPQTIDLPDGSKVTLQPQSRIQYSEVFSANKREVHLEGEAFFEVTKNAKQPFMVYTQQLVTQVIGTSFNIKSLPKTGQITVVVRSGKVAVYALNALRQSVKSQQPIAGLVLLTPNQQAVFEPTTEKLTKKLVEEPVLLHKPASTQYFAFDNAPVSEVFHTLEEAYGVTIEYDAKTFSQCSLTAPLGNEPLFRKLDIICQTIDATYEVWGTRIVIAGKGCQNN